MCDTDYQNQLRVKSWAFTITYIFESSTYLLSNTNHMILGQNVSTISSLMLTQSGALTNFSNIIICGFLFESLCVCVCVSGRLSVGECSKVQQEVHWKRWLYTIDLANVYNVYINICMHSHTYVWVCICIAALQSKRYCALLLFYQRVYLLLLCPSLVAALRKQSTKEAAKKQAKRQQKPVAPSAAAAAVNNENYWTQANMWESQQVSGIRTRAYAFPNTKLKNTIYTYECVVPLQHAHTCVCVCIYVCFVAESQTTWIDEWLAGEERDESKSSWVKSSQPASVWKSWKSW